MSENFKWLSKDSRLGRGEKVGIGESESKNERD